MSSPQSEKIDGRSHINSQILGILTDGICGLTVAAIVVVVLIQGVGRLMNSPFSWTEELTRACFIWMVFAGVAASIRHADAARVTVLLNYFPKFIKQSALPIYVLCNLTFSVLCIWTGFYLVRQQVMMNEQIATLGVPSWIVGIILPVSAALSILSLYQSLKIHRDIIAANEINF